LHHVSLHVTKANGFAETKGQRKIFKGNQVGLWIK
jgi:hypothetical protein